MSTSLVSFTNSTPMMKVMAAITMGYHKPYYKLPLAATMANEMVGSMPPNQPLPMW